MDQQQTAPARLHRRTDDKVIAGVCSGIADYFGIDPVVVRLVVVALTIAGGSGIVAYIIGWLVLPPDDGSRPAIPLNSDARRLTMLILVPVLFILLFQDSWDVHDDNYLLPLGLIGAGAYLLFRQNQDVADVTTEMTVDPTADMAVDPTAEAPAPPWAPDPPPWAPPPPQPPRPQRARSWLGLLVLGVLCIGVGLLWLLTATDAISPSPEDVVAMSVIVVGGGLVVGAWWGRSRGLIVLGVALTALLSLIAVIDVPLVASAGERTYRPETVSEVDAEYHLGAGDLLIDLTELPRAPRDVDLEATVTFGQLTVIVPYGMAIDADIHVGAGEVNRRLDDFGPPANGLDVNTSIHDDGVEGAGTAHLDLGVGFGHVVVERG